MLSNEYFKKQKELKQDMKWIDDIIEKGGYCVICGYSDNLIILEKHHIAGRNNSDITITVCPNCHRELSRKQESWDKDWNKEDNPLKLKLAFFLKGRSEVLRLMAKQDKIFSDDILKGEI